MNHIKKVRPLIKEAMRIGGRKVETNDVIEVRYPYTNEVIGTVPAGTAEHAREAFEIAAAYKPRLTRYERQQILFKAAELIRARREDIANVLTLELGISKQHALYETGRAYDVFTLSGQLAIHRRWSDIFVRRDAKREVSQNFHQTRPRLHNFRNHTIQPSPQYGGS